MTEKVGQRKLTPVSISAGVGFVPQAEKFGRDISGNQYALYTSVKDGEFVFNKGNSKTYPQGCVYLLEGWGEVAAPNVFISFRLRRGYVNAFFRYVFEKNTHGLELKPHITSGARSNGLLNISKETFFDIYLPVTSEAEQTHIAAALSSLDAVISAQADKLETLRQHKQGLMQQLFPAEGERVPRLRFPEFAGAGEWERRKLSAIIEKLIDPVDVEAETVYQEIGIRSHGRGIFHKEALLGAALGEKRVFRLKKGSLIVNIVFAWEQAVAVTSATEEGMIASHRFPSYVPKDENVDVNFVKYFLLTKKGKSLLGIASPGGAGRNRTLGQKEFENLELYISKDVKEQRAIARCLSSLDELMAAQSEKIEALQEFKRGLMQGLFPRGKEE